MGKSVIVIGAGLCGLTAAYRLQQQGFEPVVLERSERIGGRTITDQQDGFVNDLGGSLLATTYTEALQLSRELGMDALREEFGGTLQIYIKGVFHSLDMAHPVLSLLRAPYLGWASKLSLVRLLPALAANWKKLNLTDLSKAADLDVETAEAFCRRRVTPEAYDLVVNPLTRAMFGHDCNEISVVELLWMMRTYAMCSALAFRGGMQTFPDALLRHVNVLPQHEVVRVDDSPNGVVVTARTPGGDTTLKAEYCAIASDGKDLQHIRGHALTGAQNDFLSNLCYNPLSMVFFKLKSRPPIDGFIVEVPRSEDPDVAALAWYHLWGQTKVPPDKAALIFLGMNEWQFRMQDKPVEERIADARRYVRKYYPFMAELEESAEVTPWPRATTVGRLGHYKRLRAFVADRDAKARVQYGGDYMSQSSIGTAVATGNDLAARLVAASRMT
jgi:oxygen-dependent protoporphyrinogen oxidase